MKYMTSIKKLFYLRLRENKNLRKKKIKSLYNLEKAQKEAEYLAE